MFRIFTEKEQVKFEEAIDILFDKTYYIKNNLPYKVFTELARKNHLESKYYLAHCLMYGKGVTTNEKEALSILKELASENYDKAVFSLGNYYLLRSDDVTNKKKSFEWFLKSASNGNKSAKKIVKYMSKKKFIENYTYSEIKKYIKIKEKK